MAHLPFTESAAYKLCTVVAKIIRTLGFSPAKKMVSSQVQVKLSFIVIPLHVWTYIGARCHASQDHGAT